MGGVMKTKFKFTVLLVPAIMLFMHFDTGYDSGINPVHETTTTVQKIISEKKNVSFFENINLFRYEGNPPLAQINEIPSDKAVYMSIKKNVKSKLLSKLK